jgi:hypothetical protein
VAALSSSGLLNARDTVAGDTPAALAISRIEAGGLRRLLSKTFLLTVALKTFS